MSDPPVFEPFQFNPTYTVEIEPEFPGNGAWGVPAYGFNRDGQVGEVFESRWGAPLVVRVTGNDVGSWVGSFAWGGLGGVTGVFACPSRIDLCAIVGGQAYVVAVRAPDRGARVAHNQVGQVVPVHGANLLLLVSFIDIVALGPDGIAWQSERLAVDDLRVVDPRPDGVVCTRSMAVFGGTEEMITLDPASGAIVQGDRLGDPWN